MEEKEVKFELEVVNDKERGVLKLGDYEKSLKVRMKSWQKSRVRYRE